MKGAGRLIATALLVVAISGCSVGPNYHQPAPEVPVDWNEAPRKPPSSNRAQVHWWQAFDDPELDSLVERAVRANLDVRLAEARVREARAWRRIAAAPLWPSLDASGSYTRLWEDEDLFAPLSAGGKPVLLGQQPQNLFQAGFDASWELDVFGGTRRSIEAARADFEAAHYQREDVLRTLLAEVARNYIELRGFQTQLVVARSNLAAQQDTLQLTRARYEGGLASDLDVARAEAQVEVTQSQIPALQTSYKETVHRLSVLLDEPPGALSAELAAPAPIPAAPLELPADLPSEVLRQRPDLRRAERQLAAATARVGVATADLYPKFYLVGAAGLESLSASDFFTSGSKLWSIGPSITWPIFHGGQIVATIEVRDAQEQQALISYRQAILNALEEVENALVAYTRERNRYEALTKAVASNKRAVTLATHLYTSGLSDFLNILDAQRNLFQTEIDQSQSEAAIAVNFVALYKALGAGAEAFAPGQLASSRGSAAAIVVRP